MGIPYLSYRKSLTSAEQVAGESLGPAEPRQLQVASLGRTPKSCCEHASCSTVEGHNDGTACQSSQQGFIVFRDSYSQSFPGSKMAIEGSPRDEGMMETHRPLVIKIKLMAS